MQLSQQDGLTGLSNRRHFDAMLAAEHARASRHGHALTLILLDIDHFKKLNDRYGHLFGDDCLRHLGAVLTRSCQRAGDLAARYGGEEFALIASDLDAAGARPWPKASVRQSWHRPSPTPIRRWAWSP